jgi:hypothetical protein
MGRSCASSTPGAHDEIQITRKAQKTARKLSSFRADCRKSFCASSTVGAHGWEDWGCVAVAGRVQSSGASAIAMPHGEVPTGIFVVIFSDSTSMTLTLFDGPFAV